MKSAMTPRQQYLNDVARERGEPIPFHEMDSEANRFSTSLLIPRSDLETQLARLGPIDIDDEEWMGKLAGRYRVTTDVLRFRLWMLASEI